MFIRNKKQKITKVIAIGLISTMFQSVFAYVPRNIELKDEVKYSTINNLNSSSPTAGSTIRLKNAAHIKNASSKVSISLRDSDVKQVLRMLADKAKMNIIFHSSVEGKVTLDLQNTTLSEAFLFVLETCELNYYVQENTIIVFSSSSESATSFTKQNLTTIPIKYVSASSVVEFLNDNVFSSKLAGVSGSKIATSNPRTNEVMIFGTQSDAEMAKRVIAKLDTKPLINTFKVAHTTPKQMADLICKTLFAEGGDSADGEDTQDTDSDILEVSLGGGSIACKASSDSSGDASVFKAQVASVVYLEQLGEVGLYGGSYEQAELVRDFILKHDKKQPMAYIEMNIVELNESGSNNFNNNWTIVTPFANIGFSKSGLTIDGGTSAAGTTPFNVLSIADGTWQLFGNINPQNTYSAKNYISWLVDDKKGRTLANPKIMVTNGEATTIDLTSDYVKTVTTQQQSINAANPVVTRDYEIADDNGIKIEITAFISPAGYVSLDITPDFASIKQQITDPSKSVTTATVNDVVATLLQRRNLELKNIRIKDGETLVLAGFVQENETQTTTKFPFLSDVPVLGVFFRTSEKSKSKEELVIMITPHIVYSEEDVERVKSLESM